MSSTLPALPPPPLPPWCVTKKPSEICFIGGGGRTDCSACLLSLAASISAQSSPLASLQSPVPAWFCILSRKANSQISSVRHTKASSELRSEINGPAPFPSPPGRPVCLRLYFVKIFHQIRNSSHTNERGEFQSCQCRTESGEARGVIMLI